MNEKIEEFIAWFKDSKYEHTESDIKIILKKLFTGGSNGTTNI